MWIRPVARAAAVCGGAFLTVRAVNSAWSGDASQTHTAGWGFAGSRGAAAASASTTAPQGGSTSLTLKSDAVAPTLARPPLAFETEFDVVIVGGGIVGLATAREILKRYPHKTVAVLEKEREVAPHQSSHSSGVIHAGMYYAPGSVMAKTCVRGAKLMYEYCGAKGIPALRVGKFIVASTPEEHAVVEKLFQQGVANGVEGLQIMSGEEVRRQEPNVKAYSALWSPNTGIVDFSVVCRQLAEDIIETKHGDVKVQFEAQKFTLLKDGSGVEVEGVEPGQPGPVKRVRGKNVITCAGLFADRVGEAAGGAPNPKIVTFRGTYYQMKPEYIDIVKSNIYPVPSGGGIPVGVHFTPTVNERRGRQMIIGPGACLTFSREGYKFFDFDLRDIFDSMTNIGLWKFALANPSLSLGELYRDLNKRAFLRSAQKLIPTVTDDMVEESYSGVMCQVFDEKGQAAKDYIIERKVLGGKVLNVRNAPSPACTASLAIAEHIIDTAEADFGWKKTGI